MRSFGFFEGSFRNELAFKGLVIRQCNAGYRKPRRRRRGRAAARGPEPIGSVVTRVMATLAPETAGPGADASPLVHCEHCGRPFEATSSRVHGKERCPNCGMLTVGDY